MPAPSGGTTLEACFNAVGSYLWVARGLERHWRLGLVVKVTCIHPDDDSVAPLAAGGVPYHTVLFSDGRQETVCTRMRRLLFF